MTIGFLKSKKLEQYFRDKCENFIRPFDEHVHSERPAAQTQQKSTQVSLPQPFPPTPGVRDAVCPRISPKLCNGLLQWRPHINYYQITVLL